MNESLNQVKSHIRWMIRVDMPAVLEIENQSFEFPWTEEDFIRCLRERNCIGMVAETLEVSCPICVDGSRRNRCDVNEGCGGTGISEPSQVVGFMVYELHKSRLQLFTLAVHSDFRRYGVGRQMVDKLKSRLSPQRRRKLLTEVRESNLPALNFFKALGFKAFATVREFYDETDDDAIRMQFVVQERVRVL